VPHRQQRKPPHAKRTALFAELDEERPTVVICHHGMRSYQVGAFLERQGFADIYNLEGGVAAWADAVEPAMARY